MQDNEQKYTRDGHGAIYRFKDLSTVKLPKDVVKTGNLLFETSDGYAIADFDMWYENCKLLAVCVSDKYWVCHHWIWDINKLYRWAEFDSDFERKVNFEQSGLQSTQCILGWSESHIQDLWGSIIMFMMRYGIGDVYLPNTKELIDIMSGIDELKYAGSRDYVLNFVDDITSNNLICYWTSDANTKSLTSVVTCDGHSYTQTRDEKNRALLCIHINTSDETVNESSLDKDYGKPLYDYIKKGDRYSDGISLKDSDALIPLFMYWLREYASGKDFRIMQRFCDEDSVLSGKIVLSGGIYRHIDYYTKMTDGFELAKDRVGFLKDNRAGIYRRIAFATGEMSGVWDRFMSWIRNDVTQNEIMQYGFLPANAVLTMPEITDV